MKKIFVASAIASSVLLSGCLGQNALFNKVQDWNASATDEKFINQGISFAFWFIPVYGLTLFADVVVLNSVEFWTGTNPVSGKSAKVAGTSETVTDGMGNIATLTYNADGTVSVVARTGAGEEHYTLVRSGDQLVKLQEGEQKVMGSFVL
ncbi:MAG: DUF3332 family protein [Alcanivoracaceae bacterium]|jgi:hypothetical protein|nr:DUF3332 family protein [Alcanivoracaceae bacterium]